MLRIIQQIKNLCVLVIGTALLSSVQFASAEDTQSHHTAKPAHSVASKKHQTKKHHSNKRTKSHGKSHHKRHTKNHKPKHHAQLRSGSPVSDETEQTASANTSIQPLNHELATVNLNNLTRSSTSLNNLFSVKTNLVSFVKKTIDTLHYSSYKLGGSKFDPERGVYVLDCSNFVDHILENVYPDAYLSLVNSTGADNPASTHYFNFFRDLSEDADSHWNKIGDVDKLQAGDILVFRYKNSRGNETGGHVMVVMDKPVRVSDVYFIRIADSAPSRHSEDTRQKNESGIGIGTLLLKANPITGKPSAYAWSVNGDWNRRVKIAMARPVELNSGLS